VTSKFNGDKSMNISSTSGKLLGSVINAEYVYGKHSVDYNAAFCGRMSVQLGAKMLDQFSFDKIDGLKIGETYIVKDSEGNSIQIRIDRIDDLRIESIVTPNEEKN